MQYAPEWNFSEKIICEFEPLHLLLDTYPIIKYFFIYIIHTFYIYMDGDGKYILLDLVRYSYSYLPDV